MATYSRRKFISKIGAGSALFTAASFSANSKNLFQEKKLGVALVGLGSYSTNQLAPALQQTSKCYLAGIVTGTPEKAAKWKSQYNIADKNIYDYKTFDRIADNKDIDVIYVVLPNALHHEYVIRAAKAGKHVICEKPMAVSVKEGEEMVAACKKANVKLYVGYRLHFEPFNREAARVGQKKEFGPVKIVESSMGFKIGDPTQWRLKKSLAGGGAMMDVGIYAIQATRYCTGKEPLTVTAQEFKTDPVKFKDVDETIFWQMEFPDGIVTSSATSYATNIQRLYLAADNGWLEIRPAFGYGPLAGKTHQGNLDLPIVNHQATQLDAMASCLLENLECSATGEEGVRDLRVIEAIYKSISTGRKVKI